MHLLEFFFPKRCIYCLKKGSYICDNCIKNFNRTLPECFICRRISNSSHSHSKCLSNLHEILQFPVEDLNINTINEITALDVTTLWYYNNHAKELMKEAKYSFSRDIFSNLSDVITKRISEIELPFPVSKKVLIVPVPQHPYSQNIRGFNQTQLISNSLKASLHKLNYKCEISLDLIKKTKNTTKQASLQKDKRKINLKDSFTLNKSVYKTTEKENILLVDDVITTGSTMIEIASTISNKNQNRNIYGIALFRGKPRFKNSPHPQLVSPTKGEANKEVY